MASLFGQRKPEPALSKNKGRQQEGRKHKGNVSGVCIHCTKHARGYAVVDDYVIKTIRWVKRKIGVEKGNKLIVCEACLAEHKKKRAEFERSLILYGVLGMLIMFALLMFNLSLQALFTGLAILLFFLVLSHYKYTPKIVEE